VSSFLLPEMRGRRCARRSDRPKQPGSKFAAGKWRAKVGVITLALRRPRALRPMSASAARNKWGRPLRRASGAVRGWAHRPNGTASSPTLIRSPVVSTVILW
jgi:hypothetical protein